MCVSRQISTQTNKREQLCKSRSNLLISHLCKFCMEENGNAAYVQLVKKVEIWKHEFLNVFLHFFLITAQTEDICSNQVFVQTIGIG